MSDFTNKSDVQWSFILKYQLHHGGGWAGGGGRRRVGEGGGWGRARRDARRRRGLITVRSDRPWAAHEVTYTLVYYSHTHPFTTLTSKRNLLKKCIIKTYFNNKKYICHFNSLNTFYVYRIFYCVTITRIY